MCTWLVLSIAGSIIGSATESWFRDTKVGVWFYAKIDNIYTWAARRYDIKILTDEKERMKKFPELEKRLVNLENRVKELQDGRNKTL